MSKISDLIFKSAKHYLTSPFGPRQSISTSAGATGTNHQGADYGTESKKLPQHAIEDGYVFAAQKASDGANYVWVVYPRIKLAMLHYHLDTISVKAGQAVTRGTKLGTTGKTGKATGVHLHLGVRDLKGLTAAQIKKMTWTNLRKCAYIDPEKVVYTDPPVEAPAPAPSGNTYKVQSGDTMSDLAEAWGCTLKALIALNPHIKNPDVLRVGDTLNKPQKGAQSTTAAPSKTFKRYDVKITAGTLNVRKGPGTSYPITTTVRRNFRFTIVEEKNGWGKLVSGAGWISLKYTKKV